MINLAPEILRKIQLIQLDMLREVDRICIKNNIKYNIIGGTMLGAVRHSGYIPWDDDADIGFLRSEYEKFKKACMKDLDHSKYYFQDSQNTKGYRWGYGKLRRKNTLFLREHQAHMPYKQGIFIDIFPFDNVSNIYACRVFQDKVCYILRKILWSEVGKEASNSYTKKSIYKFINKIPLSFVLGCYGKLEKILNLHKTEWIRVLMFPTPNSHLGFRRKWFEEHITIEFEHHMFSVAKDYDEYLKFEFGDYMKLPSEEKRKVHPVSAIKY